MCNFLSQLWHINRIIHGLQNGPEETRRNWNRKRAADNPQHFNNLWTLTRHVAAVKKEAQPRK